MQLYEDCIVLCEMSRMSKLVEQMKERVSEFNPDEDDHDEQELWKAFIEFADAYNTFNNEKNIGNWRKAKDKQKKVLLIGYNPVIESKLTPHMNFIRRNSSPEFDDIEQNIWIYSELDRLRAPVFERYDPYNYIKRREEEERRRQEEEAIREANPMARMSRELGLSRAAYNKSFKTHVNSSYFPSHIPGKNTTRSGGKKRRIRVRRTNKHKKQLNKSRRH